MFREILGLLNYLPGGTHTKRNNATKDPLSPDATYGGDYEYKETRITPTQSSKEPMTYAEYQDYNNSVLIGAAFKNIVSDCHNHFVAERRHDEMMDELRRIR